MAINNTYKSARLLQSRRYTHDAFTDGQEAFTSTLDINANEVYIDQALIPSSNLPFSGSAQSGSIYSVDGLPIVKYYYRAGLTRSDLASGSRSEVWFLLSNATASLAGIGGQLIDGNQQTNFVSPKYSVVSLANANAEDATPGYGAKVVVSSATSSVGVVAGDQVSINNYTFDYKTGVLQFTTNATSPTTSQYVYISGYQYVGRTLSSQIGSGTGVISSRLSRIEESTASLNVFSASQEAKDIIVSNYTSSMNAFSASVSASIVFLQGSGSIQALGTQNNVTHSILRVINDLNVGGITTITNTTDTTTWNDGALIVSGGVGIGKNLYVSGSTTIVGNLTILGSSSIVNISASTIQLDDNIIRLNAYNPFQRYAGIEVMDSGSNNTSASILWDSVNDYWTLVSGSTGGSVSGRAISTTYATQGSETTITLNTIPKATGPGSIGDSYLTEDGTRLSYYTDALVVTGSSGQTYIKGKLTLVHSGGTDGGTNSSAMLFRNSSNELGYVSTTATTDVLTGILGYKEVGGGLVFSSMIDGGGF